MACLTPTFRPSRASSVAVFVPLPHTEPPVAGTCTTRMSALTDFRPHPARRWGLHRHRAHAPRQCQCLENHLVAHLRRAARAIGEADRNLANAAAEPDRAVQHLHLKGVAVAADRLERN